MWDGCLGGTCEVFTRRLCITDAPLPFRILSAQMREEQLEQDLRLQEAERLREQKEHISQWEAAADT